MALTINESVRSGIPESFTQASTTPWISANTVVPERMDTSNKHYVHLICDVHKNYLVKNIIQIQGNFLELQNLTNYTGFIQDSIDFFHHIKICLVVSVFYSCPPPWDSGQLSSRESLTNITTA